MQSELINHIFGDLIENLSSVFEGCDNAFINQFVIGLNYNAFQHKQLVQEPKYQCEEIYLIQKGAVAVCEPTSFAEPILIYTKGGAINIYNVVMDDVLDFKFVAI